MLDVKLEAKVLTEISAVLGNGNELIDAIKEIYEAKFNRRMSDQLFRNVRTETDKDMPAIQFFRRGKTDPDGIKEKDMIVNLVSCLWLYDYVCQHPNLSAAEIAAIVADKLKAERASGLSRTNLKVETMVSMFFSSDNDIAKNAAGMEKYEDEINSAIAGVMPFFALYEKYEAVPALYAAAPRVAKVKSVVTKKEPRETKDDLMLLGLDIALTIASTQNAETFLASYKSVIASAGIDYDTIKNDALLVLEKKENTPFRIYWENNINAYNGIEKKRMVIDILRKAWLYLYIAENSNITRAELLALLEAKYAAEDNMGYLSDGEKRNKKIYCLLAAAYTPALTDTQIKATAIYIREKFINGLQAAYKNILGYFSAQGFVFKPLCSCYAMEVTDLSVEKPAASPVSKKKNEKSREEELIDEISILTQQIERHAGELTESEINVIINLITALNDPRLGYPLDSLFALSKNKSTKFQGDAINLFNALKRFGIKTFGEELIDTKKQLSELQGTEFRRDIMGGKSDTVTIVAPGFKYKDVPILPIKIKQED